MPHFKLFRLLFTCIPEKSGEKKRFVMSFAFSALLQLQGSRAGWDSHHFYLSYEGFTEQFFS